MEIANSMSNNFAFENMGTTYKELFKLYDLIENGDLRSMKSYLTETLININVVLPCKGIGVLHLAVGVEPEDKSKEFTEFLLKYGADPNLRNHDGVTPVHIASIWGRVENLKLLLGCGGDPTHQDIEGLSAFDYATREQQWEVFDYLHNVVDQFDDSGSKCGYTIGLDKVLVTTDQMVAEYESIANGQQQNTTCRKSEMVRDWCEKNTLVMNQLYPTIISDTYTVDPETDSTKNITFDTTNRLSDDTASDENSFKTCKSSNNIEISGIEILKPCLNNQNDKLRRASVYENFSLPGSPNNITHKNYNSKTSLKRSRDLLAQLNVNDTTYIDRILAVAQNRTNEFLSSSCEDNSCNTRRSSASSGVSSNYSSGSIVLANVHEEYKYEDKEEDVVLIEKRLLVSPIVLPIDEASESSPDQTVLSAASSLPPSVQYDNRTLRTELLKLGFNPGPIQDSTRTLYLKKLQTLKKRPIVVKKENKTYSIELEKSLRSDEWMKNLQPYLELENKARADFTNANKKWREGSAKTSFTYLLLDPRLTDNLPERAGKQAQHLSWITFVNSIFYVGKGKRSRPYSHLYQALTLWKRDFKTSQDKKVQHILDIWTNKVGVICLHIFQNIIPAEAYTYEASMIDVIGLTNLKNVKRGNYYGVTASWTLKERKMLGMYLLYKAMLIFLNEGERQLRPDDID